MSIYQCCYTNATREEGMVVRSGWDVVAVSTDLPLEALNTCTFLQKLNSANEMLQMTDESGNILNLYEISADEKFFYVIRTQYGLRDRVGRSNMFSNAFIFPIVGTTCVKDPVIFLAISRDCFKSSEEEASVWNGSLTYDGKLVHMLSTSFDAVLYAAGVKMENYPTLIQCVYAQMTDRKSTKALYIQYDGTDFQMQALLLCIYMGIPFYLRKRLKASSCPSINDSGKNLVFSIAAKSKNNYIIPQTGENTTLDSRTLKKIERIGFVDYAVKQYVSGQFTCENMTRFFENLDKYSKMFGDVSSSNELILKLSYQLLSHIKDGGDGKGFLDYQSFEDTELDVMLSDALRSRLFGVEPLENQIATLLSILCKRGMDLSAMSESTLDEWISRTSTEMLKQAGLEYRVHKLYSLNPEKAAEQLVSMPNQSRTLYLEVLDREIRGQEIVDRYFSQAAQQANSWASLTTLWETSRTFHASNKTGDAIQDSAWHLYSAALNSGDDVRDVYREYGILMKKVLCLEEGENSQFQQCMNTAREEFWSNKTLATFSFDQEDVYRALNDGQKTSRTFLSLVELKNRFKPNQQARFLEEIYAFFCDNIQYHDESIKIILEKLSQYLTIVYSNVLARNYINWMAIVADLGNRHTSPDVLEKLCRVFQDMDMNRYDSEWLSQDYQELREVLEPSRTTTLISRILKDFCVDNDSPQNVITLDLWLLAGSEGLNCFDVFSDKSRPPYIIEKDPYVAVRESKLFGRPDIQEAAKRYLRTVDSRGPGAKAVKRWLNEWKQTEKSKKPHGAHEAPTKQARRVAEEDSYGIPDTSEPTEKQKSKGLFGGFFGRNG